MHFYLLSAILAATAGAIPSSHLLQKRCGACDAADQWNVFQTQQSAQSGGGDAASAAASGNAATIASGGSAFTAAGDISQCVPCINWKSQGGGAFTFDDLWAHGHAVQVSDHVDIEAAADKLKTKKGNVGKSKTMSVCGCEAWYKLDTGCDVCDFFGGGASAESSEHSTVDTSQHPEEKCEKC